MTQATPLSRAAILAAPDLAPEAVDVPEWGGSVLLRPLSAADQQEVMRLARMHADDPAAMATANLRHLVLHTVVDADGQPLFTDADWPELLRKSASALNRIAAAASRINKLGGAELEGAVKNSSGGPSAERSSGSPESLAAPSPSLSNG